MTREADVVRWWFRCSVLFLALLLFAASCSANSLRIRVYTSNGMQQGTCFTIGKTDDGQAVIITAAHNLENAERIQIAFRGRWHDVTEYAADPGTDLAVLQSSEIKTDTDYDLCDADDEQSGAVLGYGPEYHGRRAVGFSGKIRGSRFFGEGGLHAITGDSGAPVVVDDGSAVGVVSSIRWRAATRSDLIARDASTEIVPAAVVRQFVAQYYSGGQCGPNGCPIYVRPQIQQPRILGIIPAGPPRVVGVTPPIDRIQILPRQPQQTQQPQPNPSAPAPPDSSVTLHPDAVRQALELLAKDRPELFRGPQGPAGTQQPLRVILARDGKKIDEEVIQPGQPLILDVNTLGGGK